MLKELGKTMREWDFETLKKRKMLESVIMEEEFAADLKSGKRLTIYQGFDPTSANLHIGHLISLRVLRWFQLHGHRVIFLIGDFTGRIGDPTDKSATRKQLTSEQVLANAKGYRAQAARILDFEKENPVEIKFNSQWLEKLTFREVVELAANVTVQQMIERDMFHKRLTEQKPISLHEFLYPLMQGYDSVAMGVDAELGGRDQLFNMMVGRDLVRVYLGKTKHVLMTPLLPGLDGRKMGKTEGNTVDLSEDPIPMFFKLTLIDDSLLPLFLGALTDVDESEIVRVQERLKGEYNLQDVRESFAFTMVETLHGAKAAAAAQEEFRRVVSEGELPRQLPSLSISRQNVDKEELTVLELLSRTNLVASKSDARRLVRQGGVRLNGGKVEDPSLNLSLSQIGGTVLKIGRRGYLKIEVED